MSDSRITLTEQIAIDTAHAAVDADEHLHSTVDTAVLALSAAGLLMTPEQALDRQRVGMCRALGIIRARAREVWTPGDLLDLVAELLPVVDDVTVYQAHMGTELLRTYLTQDAARAHCEAWVRGAGRAMGTRLRTSWIADHPGPASVQGLYAWDPEVTEACSRPSIPTGCTVTPVPVASLFDPDAEG